MSTSGQPPVDYDVTMDYLAESWRRRHRDVLSKGNREMLESGERTLLIDADDTLWENNIYFEEVADRYFSFMEDLGFSPSIVRDTLNES